MTSQQLTGDYRRIWGHRRAGHWIVEVDDTDARVRLREIRGQTGTARSVTAFIVSCLAMPGREQPKVHS